MVRVPEGPHRAPRDVAYPHFTTLYPPGYRENIAITMAHIELEYKLECSMVGNHSKYYAGQSL